MIITAEKLKEILDKHLKWYLGQEGGERANLSRADLSGAKNFWIPMACPDTGSFIGWKKAFLLDAFGDFSDYAIVKLRICEDAKRSSSTGRKCRCDKAEVLEIQALYGSNLYDCQAVSGRDRNFHYIPGTIVSVPDFDGNRWEECSTGIHFFVNRQEAVDYIL